MFVFWILRLVDIWTPGTAFPCTVGARVEECYHLYHIYTECGTVHLPHLPHLPHSPHSSRLPHLPHLPHLPNPTCPTCPHLPPLAPTCPTCPLPHLSHSRHWSHLPHLPHLRGASGASGASGTEDLIGPLSSRNLYIYIYICALAKPGSCSAGRISCKPNNGALPSTSVKKMMIIKVPIIAHCLVPVLIATMIIKVLVPVWIY